MIFIRYRLLVVVIIMLQLPISWANAPHKIYLRSSIQEPLKVIDVNPMCLNDFTPKVQELMRNTSPYGDRFIVYQLEDRNDNDKKASIACKNHPKGVTFSIYSEQSKSTFEVSWIHSRTCHEKLWHSSCHWYDRVIGPVYKSPAVGPAFRIEAHCGKYPEQCDGNISVKSDKNYDVNIYLQSPRKITLKLKLPLNSKQAISRSDAPHLPTVLYRYVDKRLSDGDWSALSKFLMMQDTSRKQYVTLKKQANGDQQLTFVMRAFYDNR